MEEEARERTSCTSFVRCNDMWLAKDNRFLNPMSTYERNLMAPTCLIINFLSLLPCFYDLERNSYLSNKFPREERFCGNKRLRRNRQSARSFQRLQTISSSISSLILGSLLYLGRGMETQDNGFLLVIDGVRKEKERLTAANLLHTPLLDISSFISSFLTAILFLGRKYW